METRKLGNSDLQITRVGFGAWAIGGGYRRGLWHRALRRDCGASPETVEREAALRFYKMHSSLG